jgi:uncharacterized protein DUF6777
MTGPPPTGPPPPSGAPPAGGAPPGGGPAPGGGGGVTLNRQVLIAILVAVALVVVVVVLAVSGGDDGGNAGGDEEKPQEVTLEPISSTGANPFMPPVGTDMPDVAPPAGATGQQLPGDTPGLYGGTLNVSTCDPQQMVTFLQQNPDKGQAWATTLGIQYADIEVYVSSLTSVVTRSDIYVTNHGYANGRATEIPAVLQAGTAVLVDKNGFPVVKCYCGNPLTAPKVYRQPVYKGPQWPGFDSGGITIIVKSTVTIDIFILVDPATGQTIMRPAGGAGPDQPGGTTPGTTPGTSPITQPPTAPPQGPTPEERAIEILNQAASPSGPCYPYPAPIEGSTSSQVSTSDVDEFTFLLEVVTQTVDGGTQVFQWYVDRENLTFTPVSDLATVASDHCFLLN